MRRLVKVKKDSKASEIQMEQEGFNIEYKEDLQDYNDQKKTFEGNCISKDTTKLSSLYFLFASMSTRNNVALSYMLINLHQYISK